MGSTQQFCLKWNNHQSNMLSIFDQLLSSEHFVDVTLACDGLSVRAHKMVLSACSPFFQSLFIQNPCKHPIVILKDIRFVDLKALVQFMYRGEVNVSQDQLPTLLKAAETLKIKGLAEVTNDNQSKPSLPLGLSQNNGHHPSVPTGNSLSKPDCQQPSVQAAVTVPPTANTVAQSALVAAMQQQQQNALKAQLQAAQTAAAQHQAAQQAAAAAHESTNSNASTPLRQTDSPMSQPNRKRRRKSGSEKGSGDEGSGAESAADDMDDTRASDDESAGEEVEFEPSKLLEQSMTEVRGNQDNNSSSSEQTKDGSQPDIKPVINFDSANAGALASLNPGDPTAVLAFAAAAQAAGAASGDSVAGPSQPTHAKADSSTGPASPTACNGNAVSLLPSTPLNCKLNSFPGLDLKPPVGLEITPQNYTNVTSTPSPAGPDAPPNPLELFRRLTELSLTQKLMLFGAAAGATASPSIVHRGGHHPQSLMDSVSGNSGKPAGRYRCEFCDYHAVTPSHLRRHQRTHTGERPYECNICSRRFTQKPSLKSHLSTQHGIS